MFWFNSEDRRKRMEFMQAFVPTSKIQLKQVCAWYCKGDLRKAREMYDFYAEGVDLPDYDPVPPTWIDQAKGFFGWAKENREDIAQAYEFIRSVIENRRLPETEALPPINE